MKKWLLLLAFLIFVGCTPDEPSTVEVEAGSGATLEIEGTAPPELEPEEAEVEQLPELTEAESLLLSYNDALQVHTVMKDVYKSLDSSEQEVLSGALVLFGEDLERLKYYVDLADREPLLDADKEELLELSLRIEAAMGVFGTVIELMM